MRYQAALRPELMRIPRLGSGAAIIAAMLPALPAPQKEKSATQQLQDFFQFHAHLLDDLVAERRLLLGTLAFQA